MSTFRLVISTPQGVYLDKEVDELYLKTATGYQGIFANHDTLITAVDIGPGFIKINHKREYYAIFLGVLYVAKDKVNLILNNIEHSDSIDLKRAEASLKRADERLKDRNNKCDLKRVELSRKRALARIQASHKDFI